MRSAVLVFLIAVTVVFAFPACAQEEGAIKIIQPDGSVVVFKIPQAPAQPAQDPAPLEPEPQQPAPEPVALPPSSPLPLPQEAVQAPTPPKPVPLPAGRPEKAVTKKAVPQSKPQKIVKRSAEPSAAAPPVLPPGAEITREVAIAIALQNAPPVRSVDAFPRLYNDKPVFVVVLKTEAGDYDVLVDVQTGAIITPQ